jgi:NMD protein affecting ribosome stability and mRNA decay
MATTGRRLGEKGQRAARSTDVYGLKTVPREATACRGCGAVYRNKRWYAAEAAGGAARGEATTMCAACKRVADANPAGIVTLHGSYLHAHEAEILSRIRQTEAQSRLKNPLGRIMEITHEGDGLTIATTEDKLAQKLGRDVFKAYGGELNYRWSRDQHLVRVSWSR